MIVCCKFSTVFYYIETAIFKILAVKLCFFSFLVGWVGEHAQTFGVTVSHIIPVSYPHNCYTQSALSTVSPMISPMINVAFVALIGLVAGSFMNVIIYRGPAWWHLLDPSEDNTTEDRGTLWGPRSQCPSCGSLIKAHDNIPLISYALLGGKCRQCSAVISVRYPLVEITGAIVALLAYWLFGPTLSAGIAALFGWTLIALAAIDAETGYLPDALTLPLLLGGLLANGFGLFIPPVHAVIGAAVGFGVFWFVAISFKVLRGREGLGFGDVKLMGALGAWLGWAPLAPLIFVASTGTLVILLIARLAGRKLGADTAIRFGPALAIAGFMMFVAQHKGLLTVY